MEVFLWTPQEGVSQLPSDTVEDVTAVTFNPTGDILAIAREDGSILLQSPTEGAPRIHIAPISQGAVGALAWRPRKLPTTNSVLKDFLIIGTFDGRVVLCEITWDINAFVSKVERRGLWDDVHTDQICGIAWSNDGLSFATGANDNKVCTYEIPMGTIGVHNQWEKKFEWVHDAAVKGLAFRSGKGGVLAAGHNALSES
jgi:meiosis-specific APC/C activator protein AMA1